MTIARLSSHPGLSNGDGFTELAFSTGHEGWPTARLRVTPELPDDEQRVHQPNASTVPLRVVVRLSASLVDGEGQVLNVAQRLLVGPESLHAYQFDADAAFDPSEWLNERAAAVIVPLLRQAEGMAAAHAAGFLPAAPVGEVG